MPYLVILLLLALIGGPWLVAFALALTGVWFAIVWIITGILALICVGIVIFALLGFSFANRLQKNQISAFGAPLSKEFKERHAIEKGIWRDETHYMVELSGRTFYFLTLDEARAARDHGIQGYAPAVIVRGRLGA